jgi:hypothetical protein
MLTSFLEVNALLPTMVLAKVTAVFDGVVVLLFCETAYRETMVSPESFSDESPDFSSSFLISSIQILNI